MDFHCTKWRFSSVKYIVIAAIGCFSPAAFSESVSLASVLSDAIKNNPRVAQYDIRVATSKATLDSAKWERMPSVSGSLQQNTRGTTASTLTVTQSIWDGGKTSGNIASSQARVDISIAELEEVRQTLLTDVANIFYDILILKARHKVAADNEGQYRALYVIIVAVLRQVSARSLIKYYPALVSKLLLLRESGLRKN